MNDNNTVLEASDILRKLSYRALASELERGAKGAVSEARIMLYRHRFRRLADQLGEMGEKETVIK